MNRESRFFQEHTFFCPCPHGLEKVLEAELQTLGVGPTTSCPGGVEFKGSWPHCYQVNLESRVASRVLYQVHHGQYRDEQDLYQQAVRIPWPKWFPVHASIKVKVKGKDCPLRSLKFVTLRVKDAVCDAFVKATGARPSVETRVPDIRIYVYLAFHRWTLYLDTSGEPLFKRGLRTDHGEAPIRENLAAGLLYLAGWTPGASLLDPMCGSGTILMEAAQMARRIAPGMNRHFSFERLRNFHAPTWQGLVRRSRSAQVPSSAFRLYGYERDPDAVQAAISNIEAAGLAEDISLKQGDFLALEAPADHGFLVTNPPYGVRSGTRDELAEWYPQLGHHLKRTYPDWKANFLTADSRFPKLIGLAPSRRTPLFNGDLECRFLEFKMVRGGNRKSARQHRLIHSS